MTEAPLKELGSSGRLRYWRKVSVPHNRVADCWPWRAAKDGRGYGRFGVTGKRTRLAHHVAYFLEHGIDPAGQVVMHTCDTPSCVNPGHLVLGSHAENSEDKVRKRRHAGAVRTGAAHGRAIFTDEQASAIADLLTLGYSTAALTRIFNCSEGPVLSIKNGTRRSAETINWKAS